MPIDVAEPPSSSNTCSLSFSEVHEVHSSDAGSSLHLNAFPLEGPSRAGLTLSY